MNTQEHVTLAPFTTFHIGGPARVVVEAYSEEDIRASLALASKEGLLISVLGAGSNVLVPDAGIEGVVVRIALSDISFEDAGRDDLLVAGAGAYWENIVDAATERGVFGIENLAGIPGMLGGAVVQNIGAYGTELSRVFEYADCIDTATGEKRRVTRAEASFAYRTSFFKSHRELIIVRVALRLAKQAQLDTTYADVARAQASGTPLATPLEVARAIRAIRAEKFPRSAEEGTAGSFFKNPSVSHEQAAELCGRFPGLPTFPQEDDSVKVSLAWILDHVLSLKGYAKGRVRLYEKQPLIIVAQSGATAAEVDALATDVCARVLAATNIAIEREVETFGVR